MGIEFEIVDVHQSLKDEVDLRRREIALAAAKMVEPGDVILIDGGPNAVFLSEALLKKKSITVITNAIPVFETLQANSDIIIILTGGAYRRSSQILVGPTAEGALRELRADKLFLNVAVPRTTVEVGVPRSFHGIGRSEKAVQRKKSA